MEKGYWLLKTEPDCWSWNDQVKSHTTTWDGVRNFTAQKHMRTMQQGDHAFFYHTGKEKKILGTVTISRTTYPDPSDETGRFFMVNVDAGTAFKVPVTLQHIKSDPRCAHLPLVTQGRLSVMPIDKACWDLICSWGKII